MTFTCVDRRYVEDSERDIKITVAKIVGNHLIDPSNLNRWEVNLDYMSPTLRYSCQYYMNMQEIEYFSAGKNQVATVVTKILLPKNSLIKRISYSILETSKREATAQELDDALSDLKYALELREAFQTRVTRDFIHIPKPGIIFLTGPVTNDRVNAVFNEEVSLENNQ